MSRSVEPQFDEELPTSGRRRLRLDLLVGAGVLLVALGLGKAISGGQSDGSGAPSPSSSVSGSPAMLAPAPTAVLVTRADGQRRLLPALPPRTGDDPAACPQDVRCFTEEAGPATVLDAVLARIPLAEIRHFQSVRLRTDPWSGALWFRQLNFRVSGGELVIRLFARGADARADGGRFAGILYFRTTLQQYEVTTQVDAATGVTMDDLRRVAADERLLTT